MSGSRARADLAVLSASTAARARGWLAVLCLFSAGAGASCPAPTSAPPAQAAVASAHPLATTAGLQVLADGGNAFDAAVAVSAVLGVVEPYGSGLGGGGFWLLHRAEDCHEVMIDGRERAPRAAHADLYLDEQGEFIPAMALVGPLAAGIPGTPAALVQLSEQYGRLPLAQTLAPAITLAREGFEVGEIYRRYASWRLTDLRASAAATAQFLVDEEVPELGYRLRQPDLAVTLEQLAAHGHDGFYRGAVAERLVAGVADAGGIWTLGDLAEYRSIERAPIVGEFRGWRVVSAAPPSSGGVLLVQMLNMLDAIAPPPAPGVEQTHALVEVMRRAYRERARDLGDPDQVTIPIARLIDPDHAAGLIRDFDPARATPSPLPSPRESLLESEDTTHFSILDRHGNRVAATLSLNHPFGAGFVPPKTGVLLNNEMDDFSAQPGVPNAYGLIGSAANAIAPGKRMLSSMSPTFVESAETVAILGTPGGSRIITMVLQGILGVEAGMPLTDWVAQPRIHHQYLPDRIEFESGALSHEAQSQLAAMGHRLEPLERPIGGMQAILWDRASGVVEAASDPRQQGLAEVR